MSMPQNINSIHFVGIAGCGMSALAKIMLAKGVRVSGSDIVGGNRVDELTQMGCEFFCGHSAGNVKDCDVVVYSSAVSHENVELVSARENSIPVVHRSDVLVWLMDQARVCIGVVGTHGKTTTTSLLSFVLERMGLSPSFAIGGEVVDFSTNAMWGGDEFFVAELDESDGSFEKASPDIVIMTNIDNDHIGGACYADMDGMLEAYRRFIDKLPAGAKVFYCAKDRRLQELAEFFEDSGPQFFSYGFDLDCDAVAKDIDLKMRSSEFTFVFGEESARINLPIPGVHNVMNMVAVAGVCSALKANVGAVSEVIEGFSGIKRRFEVHLDCDDLMVVEDYGHHPNEIKATLESASRLNKRIVMVFQPHRFSRTKELFDDFVECFSGVEVLIITNVYAACENPIVGAGGQDLAVACRKHGYKDVIFAADNTQVPQIVSQVVHSGDVVVVQGAGDIHAIVNDVCCTLLEGKK